jgi:ABC-type multidrug transport system ATPase subunit
LTSDNGPEIRQRIAIMPENPGLYRRLTVTENLQLFAGLCEQRNAAARIGEALDAVNLTARTHDLSRAGLRSTSAAPSESLPQR